MEDDKKKKGLWVPIPTNRNTGMRTRYEIYLYCSDDGNGRDKFTGEKLKTFDEWLDR